MPNWVYNYLDIAGPAEDIAKLKDQVNKPFTREHDQWNAETKEMAITTSTYSNPVFAFWNIIAPTDMEAYMKQNDHTLPMEEQLAFAGDNWYDWNVRNWGTKWDVGVEDDNKYPETELYHANDEELGYKFNTAWSPPVPAIAELSVQYPNLTFTLSYEEEQGWGGEVLFVNGNGAEIESYGWKCRECDNMEDETPYCEECGFDTCPACGYNEADEPCDQHKEGHNAHLSN